MTDRIRHLTVTLDRDYRDDDVRSIVDTINHIKGVDGVALNVVNVNELLARASVEADIRISLHEAIESAFKKGRP